MEVRGTPVIIDGHTGKVPGPATSAAIVRVAIPLPPGRTFNGSQLDSNGKPLAPATTFARLLRITNLDGANAMKVYLAGSDAYKTVAKGATEEFAGNIPFFFVQGVGGDVQWEGYAVVAG